MSNKNKQRGKYYEDKIVKIFQKIFNLNKHQLYRASFSGMRNTVELNGDLCFYDPEKYPLIVECKYYQNMILDHFFPICNSYIDKWLLQIQNEKRNYINAFNKEPLTIIIAGKPYNNNHHNVIIENQVILEDLDEVFGIKEYLKFFSNKLSRHYILLDFIYINRLLEAFNLLDRNLANIQIDKLLKSNDKELLDELEINFYNHNIS